MKNKNEILVKYTQPNGIFARIQLPSITKKEVRAENNKMGKSLSQGKIKGFTKNSVKAVKLK